MGLCYSRKPMLDGLVAALPPVDEAKVKQGLSPVYLHIYDLLVLNYTTSAVGMGVYHTGVQVYHDEYCFSGHNQVDGTTHAELTGVRSFRPPTDTSWIEDAIYKESIIVGYTSLTEAQVEDLFGEMKLEFTGPGYNVIQRNCNHFTARFIERLLNLPDGGGEALIPPYVSRIVRAAQKVRPCLPNVLTTDLRDQLPPKVMVRAAGQRGEGIDRPQRNFAYASDGGSASASGSQTARDFRIMPPPVTKTKEEKTKEKLQEERRRVAAKLKKQQEALAQSMARLQMNGAGSGGGGTTKTNDSTTPSSSSSSSSKPPLGKLQRSATLRPSPATSRQHKESSSSSSSSDSSTDSDSEDQPKPTDPLRSQLSRRSLGVLTANGSQTARPSSGNGMSKRNYATLPSKSSVTTTNNNNNTSQPNASSSSSSSTAAATVASSNGSKTHRPNLSGDLRSIPTAEYENLGTYVPFDPYASSQTHMAQIDRQGSVGGVGGGGVPPALSRATSLTARSSASPYDVGAGGISRHPSLGRSSSGASTARPDIFSTYQPSIQSHDLREQEAIDLQRKRALEEERNKYWKKPTNGEGGGGGGVDPPTIPRIDRTPSLARMGSTSQLGMPLTRGGGGSGAQTPRRF